MITVGKARHNNRQKITYYFNMPRIGKKRTEQICNGCVQGVIIFKMVFITHCVAGIVYRHLYGIAKKRGERPHYVFCPLFLEICQRYNIQQQRADNKK